MTDHRDLPGHSDVLIVGAGASAAVAAKRFAEAGYSAICLEQGGWPDYTNARTKALEYEINYGREWIWEPNNRKAPVGCPINDSECDREPLMYNGVGGETVVYAGHWTRNMPADFKVRTLDGVADDWPLTCEDLEPYYVRIEDDFAVSGLAGNPAFPPGDGPPVPPAPLRKIGRRSAEAHNKLGRHWWPATETAKGSTDRTDWPINQRLGVELITGARVRQVTIDKRGLATGAAWIDRDGREHRQQGPASLCAGRMVSVGRGFYSCPPRTGTKTDWRTRPGSWASVS
jgi:choline dehydrogenase-like flavoprotein